MEEALEMEINERRIGKGTGDGRGDWKNEESQRGLECRGGGFW